MPHHVISSGKNGNNKRDGATGLTVCLYLKPLSHFLFECLIHLIQLLPVYDSPDDLDDNRK
jgi:hypothetical protein